MTTTCGKEKAIRIGVILPLTPSTEGGDDRSDDGKAAHKGLELFLEDLKSNIIFEVRDNRGDPAESIRLVREFADANAAMIIGPFYSDTALAAGETAQSKGIPMLAPSATLPSVTQSGDYVFRACFLDRQQAVEMARFAYQERGLRRMVSFSDLNYPYCLGLSEDFESEFARLGGRVLQRYYFRSDKEAIEQIEEIAAVHPDLIYFSAYAKVVVSVLGAVGPRWRGITVLGADGWDTPELKNVHPPLPNEVSFFITNHFDPNEENPRTIDFLNRFEESFEEPPGQLSALAYDACLLAEAACQAAGVRLTRDSVQRKLMELRGISGLTGTFSFDEDGNPKKSLVIQQLVIRNEDPSLELVKRTAVPDKN
ncbi:MAG: ABC transporter substrate-binding protein [Planctomycetota bacterium]|nr:ABC transporter substrate-binding protein [Planctomycetota bacterium]